MLYSLISVILSTTTSFISSIVFCLLWFAFILGIFVAVRCALRPKLSTVTCNLLALSFSSSCVFELIRLVHQRRIQQQMFLDNGPPLHCSGYIPLARLLSSYSCAEYYETVHSSIFWQLNILFVVGHLLSDLAVLIANAIGESFGTMLNAYFGAFHIVYLIPSFAIVSLCVVSCLFALFGFKFKFRFAFGLVEVDFQRQQRSVLIGEHKTEDVSGEGNNGQERKQINFVECSRVNENRVQLVKEFYQKHISSYL